MINELLKGYASSSSEDDTRQQTKAQETDIYADDAQYTSTVQSSNPKVIKKLESKAKKLPSIKAVLDVVPV